MQGGGFTNADAALRREAIELTKQGCAWAEELGAEELVVWSAYDGYDYAHQADHLVMWQRVVDAFREVSCSRPQLHSCGSLLTTATQPEVRRNARCLPRSSSATPAAHGRQLVVS